MPEEQKPGEAPRPATPPPAAPKPPAGMASTPWASELTELLKSQFGDQISEFSVYQGQEFLVAAPDAAVPILEFLKLEADFDYLVDVTAVDFPKREDRFDLVYVLYSFARNQRIRVKTRIKEGYRPRTAVDMHLTANWLEREVYDMFGIEFAGHPDMKRILMPEDWHGHPLRKDHAITQMDDQWVKENLGIESGH